MFSKSPVERGQTPNAGKTFCPAVGAGFPGYSIFKGWIHLYLSGMEWALPLSLCLGVAVCVGTASSMTRSMTRAYWRISSTQPPYVNTFNIMRTMTCLCNVKMYQNGGEYGFLFGNPQMSESKLEVEEKVSHSQSHEKPSTGHKEKRMRYAFVFSWNTLIVIANTV